MEPIVLLVVDELRDAPGPQPPLIDHALAGLRDRLLLERSTVVDVRRASAEGNDPGSDDLLPDLNLLDDERTISLVLVGPGYGPPAAEPSGAVRQAFPELVAYPGASRTELLARCALQPGRRQRAVFVICRDPAGPPLPERERNARDRLTADVEVAAVHTIEMLPAAAAGGESLASAFVELTQRILFDLIVAIASTEATGVRTSAEQSQVQASARLPGLAAAETAPAKPVRLDENVQFTVYRPRRVRPNEWYELLAFAHLADRRPDAPADQLDPLEQVRQQARTLLGPRADNYADPRADAGQAIPEAGELTFLPQVPGVEFNPERTTFRWLEDVHRQDFKLRAAPDLAGQTARGRLSVYLGAIIVAEVSLAIAVDWDAAPAAWPAQPPVAEPARSYRRIFASYSHQDTEVVEQFERLARSLGDEYLRDVVSLRAGSAWDEGLLTLIDQADVFQLFWSSHSMRSPYVRREWEYALQLGRPNFVRPTYWEEPLPSMTEPVLPPSSLLALHFHHLTRLPAAPATAGAGQGVPTALAAEPAPPPALPAPTASPTPAWAAEAGPGGELLSAPQPSFVPAPAAPTSTEWAPPSGRPSVGAPARAGKGRAKWLSLGGAAAAAVVAASVALFPLSDNATAPPPVSTSSGSPAATLEPSPGAVTVVSMQVRGATVVSGSSTPTPGSSTTVFGASRGARLRVVLTFARAATKQRVQAAAELRCLDAAGKWLVAGPKTDVVEIAAQPASEPDAYTTWQSPWMVVPATCQRGSPSGQGDGFIIGGVPDVDSGQRSELVVAGLRVR